jgi:amino acid adenylation domain-containing protein/non-ribosomal peptide synthase protein (TIGR01720 family)
LASGTESVTNAVTGYSAPASNAQRRLWFLNQLNTGESTYNIPIAVRLQGILSISALEEALRIIVSRHDSLRTIFGMQDSVPVQIVQDSSPVVIPVREVKEESELVACLVAEAEAPFSLASGPLYRAALFRLGDAEHVFALTLHHIIADGWSMNVLVREFNAVYRACVTDAPLELEELPFQFADFVQWQEELGASPEASQGFAEWCEHLRGTPQVLNISGDLPRPLDQSHRGAALFRQLSPPTTKALQNLAGQEHATLSMLLLAVFEVLLSRITGQSEFLIGYPTAGRAKQDTHNLIGFFANTLVLRADLSGGPTFRDLLYRVREECLGAFAHEYVPFDRLVDALQPERDTSRTPLFQVYFTYQFERSSELSLPGVRATLLEPDLRTAKVDLTLAVEESAAGAQLRWEYCTDVFSVATMTGFASMFETLCGALTDIGLGNPIAALPLLTDEERTEVLGLGIQKLDFGNAGGTVIDWFSRVAAANASRVAITEGERTLTYGALDRESNALAHRLRRMGVQPEARVGICLARSRDLVVAVLGVLKAGGAYVPIDPTYPQERIAYILADSGISAVIAAESFAPLAGVPVIDAAQLASTNSSDECAIPPPHPESDSAAYVIYTSGSTGQPKGCVVTHGNITRLMVGTEKWFSFGPDDVWTLFHSFAFDFSVWEIWGALLYGGRLVIVPFEVSRSPEDFYALLQSEAVTVLNQTPSAFRQLIAVDSSAAGPISLRYVIFGGEALEMATLRPWVDRHGDEMPQLVNMYGITETTVHVTYRRIRRADLNSGSVVGEAIPDLALHIVNERLEPVPYGVAGEIVVGGSGLARCYLGRPALTALRFVPNPFGPGRLYRSGDLARRLRDGGLEYLGRLDEQVKVRGFRIELGEIERVLVRSPGVREVVVIARPDPNGGKRLVAYLAGAAGFAEQHGDLRKFCKRWLPEYMIPAAFVILPELPLTGNGKIDKRRLPEVAAALPTASDSASPKTPAAITLAAIWEKVLGVPRVGGGDNFFSLGGDSILTIQVVTLARKAGLQISPKDIFDRQTLGELAAGAEPRRAEIAQNEPPRERAAHTTARAELAAAQVDVEDLYNATPMQVGMIFQSLLEPERNVYFEQVSGELGGALIPDAFRSAWQGLMDRHPSLRTSFFWRNGNETLQVVNRHLAVEWEEHDWSALPPMQQEEAWTSLLAEDRTQGFVLDKAPLWRVKLVRLGVERSRWLWSHFHALLDGWCLPLVFEDVLADYEFLAHGKGRRPGTGLPYRSYVDWLAVQNRDAAEGFWRDLLATVDLTARLAPPTPEAISGDGELGLAFTVEQSSGIRNWAKAQGVTLNTVFQGAWALLLAHHGVGDDVLFGVTVSGRPAELPGGERIIGLFINTLPLRVTVRPEERVDAWLQSVQRAQAEIRQFEFSALTDIQAWASVPGGQQLFETILVFENYPGDDRIRAAQSSLQIANIRTVERTNYMLTAAVLPGAQIALRLHFDGRRVGPKYASRLLDGWRRLVEELCQSPVRTLASIPRTSAEDRQRLLQWSEAPAQLGEEKCVHRIVIARAALEPQAEALLAPGRTVTYQAMVAEACRLAYQLRRVGVGAEARVAVCLDTSPEMVISWLAVLLAGGAFVPIDPRFATSRIAGVVEDATPIVMLLHRATSWVADLVRVPVLSVDDPNLTDTPAVLPEVAPANLAYVIHTSGSTGHPKGVLLSHAGLANLALAQAAECHLRPGRRGIQFASTSFDAAVSEVFMALVSGAAIWLEPRERVPDPAALAKLFREQSIDNATLPPVLLYALAPEHFAGLRTVLVAGEAASEELYRRWAVGGRIVLNAYGPTETTVCATMETVTSDLRPVTLGRPLANLRVFVADSKMELAPWGAVGEIVVGGPGVARGYLNQPGLTAASFVPDALSGDSGSRLYRTGDRGRVTEDGRIEFLGRIDRQAKIRGHRVEPGEVESALRSHAAVADAITIVKNAGGGGYLVSFVLLHAAVTTTELSDHLRTKLPDYLVPRSITVLPAWPVTLSGKVDRQALAEEEEAIETQSASVDLNEAATPLERKIAGIWGDVFRRPQIGLEENFFSIGGDSILSLQMIARAHQSGIRITPRQMFQNPTVRLLAMVAELTHEDPLEQEPEAGPIPLTPIQHWFFDQKQAEPHHWNQSLILELRDPSVRPVIERALLSVIQAHSSFRLRFQQGADGEWTQWYASETSDSDVNVTVHPIDNLDAITAALQSSLDLASGPLWRAAIFDGRAPGQDLLFLTVHHLVVDGVSWRILAADLATACHQLRAKQSLTLPRASASMSQWVRALTLEAGRPIRTSSAAYWLDIANTGRSLPSDFPSDSARNVMALLDVARSRIDAGVTSQLLRDANAAYRTTTNELLLAALARTLFGWTGHADHVVNLEGHGREEIDQPLDTSRTVGWFTTVFPFRLSSPQHCTDAELLRTVKENLRAVPGKGMDYGLLRYMSRDAALRQRLASQSAAPQLSFNFLGQTDHTLGADAPFILSGRPIGAGQSRSSRRAHWIDVVAMVAGGELQLEWMYCTQLHERSTIEGLAAEFVKNIRAIVDHCLCPDAGGYTPSDFQLAGLTADELNAVFEDLADGEGSEGNTQ